MKTILTAQYTNRTMRITEGSNYYLELLSPGIVLVESNDDGDEVIAYQGIFEVPDEQK